MARTLYIKKFSIKDLVTFTEEILHGKLYFLSSGTYRSSIFCYTPFDEILSLMNSWIRRYTKISEKIKILVDGANNFLYQDYPSGKWLNNTASLWKSTV